MTDEKVKKMLAVNEAQRQYYEVADGGSTNEANSISTNLWRGIRARMLNVISHEARAAIYQVHKTWIGDISHRKVLDLGCGSGSHLSAWLAQNAGEYHAIDLASAQVDALRTEVGETENRYFHVADFMSDEFKERDFDLVYAHAVFHHFEYLQEFLIILKSRLKPEGRVITFDPLATWFPSRLIRGAYRPFQTDASWEFPFTRRSLDIIESSFEVLDSRGLFNRAKWALALGAFFPKRARKLGDQLFIDDVNTAARPEDLGRSLQVSYHLVSRG